MQDDVMEIRRKRIIFRANHRGTKELDLVIGHFTRLNVAGMDDGELTQLEAILEEAEHDIYHWLSGGSPPPPDLDTPVMQRLLAFDVSKYLS